MSKITKIVFNLTRRVFHFFSENLENVEEIRLVRLID